VEGDRPGVKSFKAFPIGYFPPAARQSFARQTMRRDIAEVQTAEGSIHGLVVIDRTSTFAFVPMVRRTGEASASACLAA
jgi:hypothetical protein